MALKSPAFHPFRHAAQAGRSGQEFNILNAQLTFVAQSLLRPEWLLAGT